MKINLPKYILEIIEKIESHDFEAFIVGGSVRDSLLGIEPSDYDLTTNAKPSDIENIFKDYKTIDIGKDFGTIIVRYENENVDITTYRTEDKYIDGRRPSEINFTSNIKNDLSRRDFTINAMAYNPKLGLVDYFNGQEDLKNKTIRTVGNPKERFKEDHLRILRAVRFATELDFKIEDETYKACREYNYTLKKVSQERIRDEFFKIILSEKPSIGLNYLENLDILAIIVPELDKCVEFDQKNPYHDKDVFEHSLCVVDHVKRDLETRLAALFHDIGKPETFEIDEEGIGHFYGHEKVGKEIAVDILRRFNSPKELITNVSLLIKEHMGHNGRLSDRGIRRLIYRVKEENIYKLLDIQRADILCSKGSFTVELIDERKDDVDRILKEESIYEKNKLKINGYDIINLGFKEGKKIGMILDFLMDKVLEDPDLNNRDDLINLVRENYM